jgi:hypothetical protein
VTSAVVAAALLTAACTGAPAAAPNSTVAPAGDSAAAPAPDGATAAPVTDGPSPQAVQVCSDEARGDLALALGVDATTVGPLQWANGVSSCRYAYPQGSYLLLVHDLPDAAATSQAYAAYATKMGRVQEFYLGPAQAFTTTNGSVVMQKDTKVLLVDVSGLPAEFGRPPVPRPQAALLITKTILGCWTE